MPSRSLRNGRRFALIVASTREPLPDKRWRMTTERGALVTEEGANVTRRLFALLEAVGDRGVHLSLMCEILGVNTASLDPLLGKLRQAGRVDRMSAPRQFAGMGSIYRLPPPAA
jgi:hypothetical protein